MEINQSAGLGRRRRYDPRHLLGVNLAAALLVLAGCGSTPEHASGKPWHHLDNGQFRNPRGSPVGTATFGDMAAFLLRRMRDEPPVVPAGHVVPQAEALIAYAATDDEDTVTWLGHAAFLLRLGGKTILTDPYLTDAAGPFGFGPQRYVAPGLPFNQLPAIDFILVSHNHYDHLDAKTIEALPGKERIHVIVPLKLGAFFRARGYVNVHEHDWFERVVIDGIEIEMLPAIHFSRRSAFDRNRTLWGGFAIRAAGVSIYHSGDTGYGPIFREIGERAGPFDLALVAIGAYEPRSIMRSSHVTPEQAVQLVDDINAKIAIAMHWGTVKLTDEPPFEAPIRFRNAARDAGWSDGRARVMKIGETAVLSTLIDE